MSEDIEKKVREYSLNTEAQMRRMDRVIDKKLKKIDRDIRFRNKLYSDINDSKVILRNRFKYKPTKNREVARFRSRLKKIKRINSH